MVVIVMVEEEEEEEELLVKDKGKKESGELVSFSSLMWR